MTMASLSGVSSTSETSSPTPLNLKGALRTLKRDPYSISLLKLISCNGGCGRGVSFTSSSVVVNYVRDNTADIPGPCLDAFTEIFATGNTVLMDFLEKGQKPVDENQCRALESLLTFTANIKGEHFQ